MEIVKKVKKYSGQIATVYGERPCKVKKSCADKIVKKSTFQIRLGVEFDNLKNTKEKRKNGELPAENSGLPNWAERVDKTMVKNVKSGELYLRGKPNCENKQSKREAVYVKNGLEVPFEEVENDLLASEKRKNQGDWIYYKIANIKNIK